MMLLVPLMVLPRGVTWASRIPFLRTVGMIQ
jgi:hypothetical protein